MVTGKILLEKRAAVLELTIGSLFLVLEGGGLEVSNGIGLAFFGEFDFVLDGSAVIDTCGCLSIAVCVGSWDGGGDTRVFGIETLDFLLGLGDVLFVELGSVK